MSETSEDLNFNEFFMNIKEEDISSHENGCSSVIREK